MATTNELILKFTGDRRQLQEVIAATQRDLARLGQSQVATTTQTERLRLAETIRSANQRLREEQRVAREVVAEERRLARSSEALQRQRSAALVAIWKKEQQEKAKAERETSKSSSDLLSQVPIIGRLVSQFSQLDSSATAAGGAIASVAAPIAAVTVAATAGVAALALLGKTIFDLSKQTAEFEGKFFDLSQQVGVSVETLSTLDVIASTTGGNIESVTASLGIFQKHLEASHDPTSKEAKLLKELGVTSLDTEVALRQSIKGLFALGESAEQTDAVLQLFGKSGRFVNAILKESKGDLDAAREAFGGLVIARDAAAAADAFNDSLEIMNRNLFAVVRQITGSAIPVFTVFFQQINQALTGNKNDWSSWSDVIQVEVAAALGAVQGFAQFVASQGRIPLGVAIDANIRALIEEANKLKNKLRFESDIESIQRLTRSILAGGPGDRPDAEKAAKEAEARAAKELSLRHRALEDDFQRHRQRMERERDQDIKNIDEWENESIIAIADHVLAQGRLFEQEIANARRFIENKKDLELAEVDIALRRAKVTEDSLTEIDRIKNEAQKRRDQTELRHIEHLFKQTEAERQQRLELIKIYSEREATVLDAEIEAEEQRFLERKAILEQELNALSTTASRQAEIQDELKRIQTEFTTKVIELTSKRIEAIRKEIEEWQKLEAAQSTGPGEGRTVPEPPLNPVNPEDIGLPPPRGVSVWQDLLKRLREQMESFTSFVRGTFLGVFEGIADAVAQSAYAWALYGESFGQAMKKALAALAAKIAAEAALQAVLEAAYALASLAVLDFRGAAQHGLAAAKFAAVAALAGFGARAIAGNSFQSTVAGRSSAETDRATARGEINPLTLDRNRAEPRRIIIEVRAAKDKISQAFEAVVVRDINGAGRMRQAFADDGAFG